MQMRFINVIMQKNILLFSFQNIFGFLVRWQIFYYPSAKSGRGQKCFYNLSWVFISSSIFFIST